MTDNMEIPASVKARLLRDKAQLWRNTYFDAQVDVQVAETVGDEGLREQAMERMKGALKAVRYLEKMLKGEGAGKD